MVQQDTQGEEKEVDRRTEGAGEGVQRQLYHNQNLCTVLFNILVHLFFYRFSSGLRKPIPISTFVALYYNSYYLYSSTFSSST